jgi:hypothetical protein
MSKIQAKTVGGENMILEDEDIIKLCKLGYYRALIDMNENKIGIEVVVKAIPFPNSIDYFLNEHSDNNGIYWIARKEHEELEVALLKLGDTIIKRVEVKTTKQI